MLLVSVPKVAMVFAAGFGKRMYPLTADMPKPLIKLGNKSIIDYNLDGIEAAGVSNIVVNAHYMPDMLQDHLFAREGKAVIDVSYEDEILETGGGIIKALPLLGDKPFYTVNGDVVFVGKDNPLLQLADVWDENKMDVLMLLYPVANAIGYDGNGDFDLTMGGRVIQSSQDEYNYVYTGMMIVNPEIFKGQKLCKFSVYRDFIKPKYMQDDGSLSRVHGVVYQGKWLHIGTPVGLELAEQEMLSLVGDNVI